MIKEFDLDAPLEEKMKRHTFRLQTRCMTALFERFFTSPREAKKVWKILVRVVPTITDSRILDFSGVLVVQIEGDVDYYFNLPNSEKKKLAIEWLWVGINKVLNETNWNESPFKVARQSVVDSEYQNQWYWRKSARSPSRDKNARLFVEHDVGEIRLFVHVYDAKGVRIKDIFVVSDKPDEFIFNKYFGKLEWNGDESIYLISKDGKENWLVNLR